ncbi:MAG: TIGR03905 family TSCPD domain-containing protein [Oscillospiraceae bacterium]|jgi:uncharacterized protein (TIGR03905 family)
MKYRPQGVCSRYIDVTLDGSMIKDINIEGGCPGFSQAVIALLIGMDAAEAIKRLKGISCGTKPTSCPDQISAALEKAVKKQNKAPALIVQEEL